MAVRPLFPWGVHFAPEEPRGQLRACCVLTGQRNNYRFTEHRAALPQGKEEPKVGKNYVHLNKDAAGCNSADP